MGKFGVIFPDFETSRDCSRFQREILGEDVLGLLTWQKFIIKSIRAEKRLSRVKPENISKNSKWKNQSRNSSPDLSVSSSYSPQCYLQSMIKSVNTKSVDKYTLCSNVLALFRASEIANSIFLYFAKSTANLTRKTLSTYCDFLPILSGSLLKIPKICW